MEKRRILIVEDHKLLLQAIQDLLEGEGYEVTVASDGIEALEKMDEQTPDLIVSDIMMPEMDGYTLYETVRANTSWTRIPFIFLTARGERGDIIKGKALGVEDYITKPFDTEELVVAIQARLQRAEAIQQATHEEFEEIKQQIANVLSHELRTPLTYISGYTELALDDITNLSPQELQDFLMRIKRGSDRLNNLVEDLLLSVQLDMGRTKQEFENFAQIHEDVNSIIRRVALQYTLQAREEGVNLDLNLQEDLPPIKTYVEFLNNILGQLLDNAIKFSRGPKKVVTISSSSEGKWVNIAVSDRGIGIPSQDIPRIFERFQQLERSKLEQQGTGMGLFIADALIKLHGGKITVQSEQGAGSTFTLHLPRAERRA